jgi:hypothetical protein
MKLLTIALLVGLFGASPLFAGTLTIQNFDPSTCGLSAARLLVNTNDDAVIFPEDYSSCRDAEDGVGDAANAKALLPELNGGAVGAESSWDLAVLPQQIFAKSANAER